MHSIDGTFSSPHFFVVMRIVRDCPSLRALPRQFGFEPEPADAYLIAGGILLRDELLLHANAQNKIEQDPKL